MDERPTLSEVLKAATESVNKNPPPTVDYGKRGTTSISPRQAIIDRGEAVAQALEDIASKHSQLADKAMAAADKARKNAFENADHFDAEMAKMEQIADILDPPKSNGQGRSDEKH